MNKKIINSLAVIILIIAVLLLSKDIQKNKFETIYNIANKSNYKNLNINKNSITFLSTRKKEYIWSGDSCGEEEIEEIFEKTMLEDEQYLCEISEVSSGSGFGGGEETSVSKNVTIEFTNLNRGYCEVWINEYDKDGQTERDSEYMLLSPGKNSYTITYNTNKDYKHYIYCSVYVYPDELNSGTPYVDNLKSSELSTEEIVRKIKLTPTISLDQDLDLIDIKSKILSDNPLLSYSIDFKQISPQTTSYKQTTSTRTYNIGSSSYCYGDSYTFDETKGTYTLKNINCYKASKTSPIGKYTYFSSYNYGYSYSYIYKVDSLKESGTYNVTQYGSAPASYDTGLYEANTSNGTTYYYRGTVQNNYVKFAGYIWRIIRINENGTIRMILDGDIGSTKWNDSNKYKYYTGYTYGAVDYYPLMSSSTDSTRYDIDYTNTYCYSNSFKYNSSSNTYQLTGDIKCEKITADNYYEKFYNKYTLHKTSKNDTSKIMYKLNGRYDNRRHYLYVYNTENQAEFDPYYETCYGSDYEIVNGSYKLKGTITCDVNLSSSNYKSYKNKYTVYKNTKDGTNTKMYKFIDCPNCKSGTWSRYDEFNHRFYQAPVYMYTDSDSNKSNPKKMLDNWYSSNLSPRVNMNYLRSGTFCNDTSGITNSYGSGNAYKRLNSQYAPSFDCTGTFEYGGKYNEYIGMISADELAFAGASMYKINNNYYLAYYKPYWTMTPSGTTSMYASTVYTYNSDTENINGFSTETINANTASNAWLYAGDATLAVRPVINIDGYAYTYRKNKGTKGDPYEIIDDDEIINAYYSEMYGY